MKKQKVIICGKGELAIKVSEWFLLSSDYELICIIPVIPEPNWTESFVEWGVKNKIKIVESGKIEDIVGVSDHDWKIDLVVSVFFDKIIKKNFIDKCNKIINIHNGPLPRYRGVSPINWALKNNEVKHGVTIHEITEGIDDGPIIAQVDYSIYPEIDEVEDVYKRSLKYAYLLFTETIVLINRINPYKQDAARSLYYSKSKNRLLGSRKGFTRKSVVLKDHKKLK